MVANKGVVRAPDSEWYNGVELTKEEFVAWRDKHTKEVDEWVESRNKATSISKKQEVASSLDECNEPCEGCRRDVGDEFICPRYLERKEREGAKAPVPGLGEKRFEVVLDFGKPASERVATLEEVRAILKKGWEMVQADPDHQGDAVVYLDGEEITDTMAIQEMIADIMEGECDHDPRSQSGQSTGMYHCPDCGEMVVAGLPHPKKEAPESGQGPTGPSPDHGPECECRLCFPVTFSDLIAAEELEEAAREEYEKSCTYGDAPADTKCSICGRPMCTSCGFKLGEDKLCNACWEMDPR